MSGSVSFESKGGYIDLTAEADLSPVSDDDIVSGSSGSEKNATTAGGQPAKKKAKKETKKKAKRKEKEKDKEKKSGGK
jgi:hypothetical protein